MGNRVDAVIAALRTVLAEAEARQLQQDWPVHIVNRWIGQLPGAWLSKWRRLRLRGLSYDRSRAHRADLITHVRATLAYLDSQREVISEARWWSTGWRRRPSQASQNAPAAAPTAPVQRPKWLN
jgi:hypothetical protein